MSFRAFFLNGVLEKNPQLCVVINDGSSELGLQLRSIQECYSGSSRRSRVLTKCHGGTEERQTDPVWLLRAPSLGGSVIPVSWRVSR